MEREQFLKKSISENLIKEEQDCTGKLNDLNEMINNISIFRSEVQDSQVDTDLEFLNKVRIR
jgi:hypothetical protein